MLLAKNMFLRFQIPKNNSTFLVREMYGLEEKLQEGEDF